MKKGIMMCVIAAVCFFAAQSLLTEPVRAEGATVDIVCDREEVSVGDEVVVSLMLKSSARLGGFEAFLSYNSNILEFVDADDGIAGGDGALRISDPDPVRRSKTRDYKITFKAVKVGGCQIAFEDRILIYDDETDNEMSVSATDLSIKVKAAVSASEENRLKTLKVSPGQLQPEFDAETTEYNMTVDADTEKLVISAIALDSKARVEVSGNGEFTTGTNKVIITVTAENSDTKEYTILVEKTEPGEAAEDETAADKEDEIAKLVESDFTVIGIGKDFCFTGRYNYTVTAVESAKDIPEGYEGYTLELQGKRIPAYKPEGEKEPSKVLLYVESGNDGHDFYEFDIAAKSMERISAFKTVEKKDAGQQPAPKDKDDTTVLYIIIVVLFVIAALLGLALIGTANKGKKKRRK